MRTFLFFYTIVLGLVSEAQTTNNFFVFAITGKSYYTRSGIDMPLKIGTPLSTGDELVIAPGSAVKILCNNYSLFNISAGNTKRQCAVKNYLDSCKQPASSVTSKALKFIWEQFQSAHAALSADKNENLQEYGAAVRGCVDNIFSNLPGTIAIYKKTLLIKYQPADSSATYSLNIFMHDAGGFPIYRIPLKENHFACSPAALEKLNPDLNYYYTITKNGMQDCGRKVLRKLGDDSFLSLTKMIASSGDYEKLSSDEKDFVHGYFLEKDHVYAEALEYFFSSAGKNHHNILMENEKHKLILVFDAK